jgi:hypothetical protein
VAVKPGVLPNVTSLRVPEIDEKQRISRLVMVTPFHSTVAKLAAPEQLVLLKGCVLCQITRDVAAGSIRTKPEWRSCRDELGVRIDVQTVDVIDEDTLRAINSAPPAVCAVMPDGGIHLLLDAPALERCNGSVVDFRGRLLFRIAALGLAL